MERGERTKGRRDEMGDERKEAKEEDHKEVGGGGRSVWDKGTEWSLILLRLTPWGVGSFCDRFFFLRLDCYVML